VFNGSFSEAHSLRDIVDGKVPDKHPQIDASDFGYDVYHNLFFTLYTKHLVGAQTTEEFPVDLPIPTNCDQEDLYALADKYQLFWLRDLIGEHLVKSARGNLKRLLEGLFGDFSTAHPELRDAYYAKVRLSGLSVEPMLKEFIKELTVAERADASMILCRMVGEKVWIY